MDASASKRLVLVLFAALLIGATVAYVALSPADPASDSSTSGFEAFAGDETAQTTPADPTSGSQPSDSQRTGSSRPGDPSETAGTPQIADSIARTDAPAAAPKVPTTIVRLPDGGVAEVPSMAAAKRAGKDAAALGPSEWSATISPEEEAEIQAAFDAIPAPDPRVTRRDRKSSIEVARAVVEDCFRELQVRSPGRRGRIAVAWTASASRGRGLIADPEITLNLKLDEALFEQCVTTSLDGLTYPAMDEGEPLRVEYPFFFDG